MRAPRALPGRRPGRPGRAGRADAGMSLVELSVAMLITGVLLAAVAAVTIGTLKAARVVNVKVSTAADARIGMETVSRTLRTATVPTGVTSAVTTANTNAITFYSTINRANSLTVSGELIPTLIEYYYTGGCLMEAQTPARVVSTGVYAWDTGRVAKCVLRTTQAPTFSYYTSGSASTALTVPTGGLVAADRQSVQSVEVALTVTDANNTGVGGIPMDVRITLDNVVLKAGGTT